MDLQHAVLRFSLLTCSSPHTLQILEFNEMDAVGPLI